MTRWPASCGGFTYIAILLAVALHAAVLASVGIVWHHAQQREKEQELLFVGDQFRKALRSYATGGPGVQGVAPQSLDELLRDPRFPNVKRHLRKIFVDPMTGKTEWGLVRTPDGKGILGVYSLSEAEPLKNANFADDDKQFEGKTKYSEWKFALGQVQDPKARQPGAPGQAGVPGAPTAPGVLAPGLQMGQPQPAPGAPQPAAAPAAPAQPVQPTAQPAAQPASPFTPGVLSPAPFVSIPASPPPTMTPAPAAPAAAPAPTPAQPEPEAAPAPEPEPPQQEAAPAPEPEPPQQEAAPASAPAE